MSKHVWEKTGLYSFWVLEDVLKDGVFHMQTMEEEGTLSFDDACRFVGYYMERRRQASMRSFSSVLEMGLKSKLRFARGKNRDNYHKAGSVALEEMAGLYFLPGTDEGMPANMVWDWIRDNKEAVRKELAGPPQPVYELELTSQDRQAISASAVGYDMTEALDSVPYTYEYLGAKAAEASWESPGTITFYVPEAAALAIGGVLEKAPPNPFVRNETFRKLEAFWDEVSVNALGEYNTHPESEE